MHMTRVFMINDLYLEAFILVKVITIVFPLRLNRRIETGYKL